MKIVYDPPGGKRQEWPFEAGQLTIAEAIYAEDYLDMPTGTAIRKMIEGSVTCMRVYLLIMRRRDEPNVQMSDLDDIQISHISFDYSDDEDEKDEGSGKEPTPSGEDKAAEPPAA